MKAIITLEPNAPAKVETEKGGARRSIYLDNQKLAQLIVSSIKEDLDVKEKVRPITISPTLPLNTVKYAKMNDDTDLIFMIYPEVHADITYHRDEFKDVPFPNLVFCFGVRNNRVGQRHVFSYKDRILREDTELYRYPFSNVYEGGKMCFHDNQPIHDLVELQSFPHNWIRAPFNDHLFHQDRTTTLNKPLRGLFQGSQGKPFNYEILTPVNRTFQKWADSLLSG